FQYRHEILIIINSDRHAACVLGSPRRYGILDCNRRRGNARTAEAMPNAVLRFEETIMKDSKRIKGVLAPVVTPFKSDYSPDHNRFVAQCKWMLTQGSGLAVFGTNSEANSLSANERIALLDSLLQAGVDPARMMPGTGCCAFTDTV